MTVAKYDHYPAYHPEEGGYYYDCSELVETYRVDHGKGHREIRKIYRRLMEEREDDWRVWINNSATACGYYGKYIGDGCEYRLEGNRHPGRNEAHPSLYC